MKRAWIASLFVPLSGCIVIAPGFDSKEHCPIDGTSACGECLREKCPEPIDACCGSDKCRGETMTRLDDCAKGSTSCVANLAAATPTPEGDGVTSCAQVRCAAICNPPPPTPAAPKWSCVTTDDFPSTPCTDCVRDSCKDDISLCCSSNTCGTNQTLATEMAGCFNGDTQVCSSVSAEKSADRAGLLRECITNNCPVCYEVPAVKHRVCTNQAAGWCTCADTPAPSDSGPTCAADNKGGECHEYPQIANFDDCVCGHWICSGTADSCGCSFALDFVPGRCGIADLANYDPVKDEGKTCCLDLNGDILCSCGLTEASCGPAATPVADCHHDTIIKEIGNGIPSCSH